MATGQVHDRDLYSWTSCLVDEHRNQGRDMAVAIFDAVYKSGPRNEFARSSAARRLYSTARSPFGIRTFSILLDMRMGNVRLASYKAREMKMNKNTKFVISLLAFCFLVIGLAWIGNRSRVLSESKPSPEVQSQSGVERINAKARAVKGPDTEAIKGLTDEIMSQYGWDDAPASVKDSIKNRLVSAEEKFHKGNHKGVSDTDVARAVNGFVVKFNTPAYTRTSPSEVKEIRGHMIGLLPDFIGRGRVENGKGQVKKRGSTIEEMSPVEAAYTTMAVVYQKMSNPDFQLTQDERRAAWIEKHSKSPNSVGKSDAPPSAIATARQQEMDGVLRRVATTTPLQDLFSLPDKVLDVLGIERQKKEDK